MVGRCTRAGSLLRLQGLLSGISPDTILRIDLGTYDPEFGGAGEAQEDCRDLGEYCADSKGCDWRPQHRGVLMRTAMTRPWWMINAELSNVCTSRLARIDFNTLLCFHRDRWFTPLFRDVPSTSMSMFQ